VLGQVDWNDLDSACGARFLRYLKGMNLNPETNGDRFAEFTLDEGCLLCGGAVAIRATPSGAHSYCPKCHWLSRPKMRVRGNGLELSYATTASA
jgi:hypothetical protein